MAPRSFATTNFRLVATGSSPSEVFFKGSLWPQPFWRVALNVSGLIDTGLPVAVSTPSTRFEVVSVA